MLATNIEWTNKNLPNDFVDAINESWITYCNLIDFNNLNEIQQDAHIQWFKRLLEQKVLLKNNTNWG